VAPDGQLDPAAVDHERAHRLGAGGQDPLVGGPVDALGQRVASISVATASAAEG
jgi:hypothetical protein